MKDNVKQSKVVAGAVESLQHTTTHEISTGDSESDGGCSCWAAIVMLFNTINHVLVLLTTGYLVYLSWDLSNTTNLHVLLCTIGYVLLMSEAIVVLTGENVWTRNLTRRSNSYLHCILQVTGACFSVAGVAVKYAERRVHFKSIHALTGISSVGAIAAIFLSGFPALFAGRLRKVIRPVTSKFLHNILGILCFVVGMVSQCYGYQKGWLRRKAPKEMVTVLTVTTALIALFSLVGALRSLFDQFKGLLNWRRDD